MKVEDAKLKSCILRCLLAHPKSESELESTLWLYYHIFNLKVLHSILWTHARKFKFWSYIASCGLTESSSHVKEHFIPSTTIRQHDSLNPKQIVNLAYYDMGHTWRIAQSVKKGIEALKIEPHEENPKPTVMSSGGRAATLI